MFNSYLIDYLHWYGYDNLSPCSFSQGNKFSTYRCNIEAGERRYQGFHRMRSSPTYLSVLSDPSSSCRFPRSPLLLTFSTSTKTVGWATVTTPSHIQPSIQPTNPPAASPLTTCVSVSMATVSLSKLPLPNYRRMLGTRMAPVWHKL